MTSSLENKKETTSHNISLEVLCKAHLDALLPHLREEDAAELWAAYRLPAAEGLALCLKRSAAALALCCEGEVCAAAGVEAQSLLGRSACIWSWTGKGVLRRPKAFWKASLRALAYFGGLYPQLYAACDGRYAAARRYLLRLGARRTGEGFYLAGKETKFYLYRFDAPCGAENSVTRRELWEEQ